MHLPHLGPAGGLPKNLCKCAPLFCTNPVQYTQKNNDVAHFDECGNFPRDVFSFGQKLTVEAYARTNCSCVTLLAENLYALNITSANTFHSREKEREDTSETRARHKRDTSETPARHQRDTSETPARHQRDTSETPARHKRDTSETRARHQRDTSETPARHQRDTSETRARHERDTE